MRSFFLVFLPGIAALIAALVFAAFLFCLFGWVISRLGHTLEVRAENARMNTEALVKLRESQAREQKLRDLLGRVSIIASLTPGGVPYPLKAQLDAVLLDERGAYPLTKDNT